MFSSKFNTLIKYLQKVSYVYFSILLLYSPQEQLAFCLQECVTSLLYDYMLSCRALHNNVQCKMPTALAASIILLTFTSGYRSSECAISNTEHVPRLVVVVSRLAPVLQSLVRLEKE